MISPPKTNFDGYSDREKIHFKLALNITDELRRTQWEQKDLIAGRMLIPAGQAIADDVPVMARTIFSEVVDIKNNSMPPVPVDGTLTPKLVNIGFTLGKSSFSQSTMSLKVEWTLTDPAGKVVWDDTVTGAYIGSTGGTQPEKKLKLALEDLMRKSQRQIWGARTIRQFARIKYPEVTEVNAGAKNANPTSELSIGLESSNPDEVGRALKGLRRSGTASDIPDILPCLKHANPNVVRDACRTLAVLGNKDTIPYIKPLLKHKRKDVRKDAQDAIDKLNAKP